MSLGTDSRLTAAKTSTSTYVYKSKDNKKVSSCLKSTASESLAVNMTQQIERRSIGKATEETRESL